MSQILKMQVSLAQSGPAKQVLVYNEDRSIMQEWDATPDLLNLMDGLPKRYFYYELTPENGGYSLNLGTEAPPQTW